MMTLSAFLPRPMNLPWSERLRGAIGGGIGIAVTAVISLMTARALHLSPWLVAPLGASAVLVFAAPASPLAQPWAVIGGNTVTAIMGVLACHFIPDPVVAASVAVGLAIAAMFALRCLHPPGGAMALLVVLTHTQAPLFVLFPAFTNSLLLVAAGVAYHALTRHSYPHIAKPAPVAGLVSSDFEAALAGETELLDIDPADLKRLIAAAERHAEARRTSG